jgi:hypothetical protein
MNKLDSAIVENKESTCQVSHPAIGKIYCLDAPEARATLHEICDEQLYLQAGISISVGDVVLDIATLGCLPSTRPSKVRRFTRMSRCRLLMESYSRM